ncbi:hypothetical protein [Paenibacillus sp. FSL R7-0272]|uniref:hypothetical protein n=1 Tax=Paenibacillus sp. FSL R7-0272 TaxID=2921679 RepID=UPI0030EB4776
MKDIDSINKIAQICFYCITIILGFLTFRNAKRGLLNPVNTEYHKKVIERLSEVSEELASEFYNDSEKDWFQINDITNAVDRINDFYLENKEEILSKKQFPICGYPLPELSSHLRTLISRINFDPFIPIKIRDLIIELLENRLEYTESIIVEELDRYCDELAEGLHTEFFEHNDGLVQTRVNKRLSELGLDESQVQEAVNDIQIEIQHYFRSFQP